MEDIFLTSDVISLCKNAAEYFRKEHDVMNNNMIFAACQIKINYGTSIRKYRSF